VRLRLELMLATVVAMAPLAGGAQPDAPVAVGGVPTRAEVRTALDEVANDPNLAAERTVNMLRWKEAEPVTDEPKWWQWANAIARWVRGLFNWMAESARLLVWVLGALAAVLLAIFIARLVRARGVPRVPKQFVAPSHVRDLDIRPESLPDDVGAAALGLWQRGEQRAALALLYRGTLSRLVHVHAVPIRASSTEGECLALARPRLAESSARYTARLVETWAAAVYGAREPAVGAVQALCGEFAAALDRKVAA
jgi:Domain of unknown function (DUF4129)